MSLDPLLSRTTQNPSVGAAEPRQRTQPAARRAPARRTPAVRRHGASRPEQPETRREERPATSPTVRRAVPVEVLDDDGRVDVSEPTTEHHHKPRRRGRAASLIASLGEYAALADVADAEPSADQAHDVDQARDVEGSHDAVGSDDDVTVGEVDRSNDDTSDDRPRTSRSRRQPKQVNRWRTHGRSPYRQVKYVDERPSAVALGPAPVTYYALVVLVTVFVMLGLVMVLSATSVNYVGSTTSPYSVFIRQSIWAVLGFAAMVVVLNIPYQKWRLLVVPGFLAAAVLMGAPFVPGLGMSINNARSWIRVGGYSMQPSEFLKLASICFLASYLTRNEQRVHFRRWGLYPLAIVTFGAAGLAFVQGDLGSAIVLAASTIAVAVIGGVPMRDVGMVLVVGVGGAIAAVMTSPRRFHRLTAFIDPQGNKDDLAFQSWQGRLSIANGGFTGSGIGGSRSKMGYLPLAHSDFIFAVIADELGFIGSLAVVGGFIVLVWLGLQVARAAPDQFGTTLAAGITAWFGVQAIVNLGGVVGLMPVTGLTLPFFSAGGTSLFVSMVAAALLMNVARRGITESRPAKPPKPAGQKRTRQKRSAPTRVHGKAPVPSAS